MQRQDGQTAKGTTTAEFEWVLSHVREHAEDDAFKHRHLLKNPKKWRPMYGFDRARIHNVQKALAALKCAAKQILPIPHYAPDFQKAVEHVHGYCKSMFRKRLRTISPMLPIADLAAHYDDIFFSVKAESVRKDIESLPLTYKHILQPISEGGSDGGYAMKGFN